MPLVTVTLSSDQLDLVHLRKLGLDVEQRFKALPNTGLSFVTGGSLEQVRVEVDPSRLASFQSDHGHGGADDLGGEPARCRLATSSTATCGSMSTPAIS